MTQLVRVATSKLVEDTMLIKLLLPFLAIALVAPVFAADMRPLLAPGEEGVTFKLHDKDGKTPQLVLFRSAQQADTAASINYWRDTPNAGGQGVLVEFKGIRFLRAPDAPGELIVRLIGIKNELELNTRLPLAELESGKPQKMHFGPVAIGAAGLISGTTDADMQLTYDPTNRSLKIPKISGKLDWKRIFRDAQSDSGSLSDVTGRVGEVVSDGTILRAPEE
jgi:hypothetical protein